MASGTRPLGGGSCRPERAAALAKIATLSGQAMEQLVPDPMGVLNASSRMIRILAKDTVYGAIGNQIFQPIWVFASREPAMSFMGEATQTWDICVSLLTKLYHDTVAWAEEVDDEAEDEEQLTIARRSLTASVLA